MKKKENIVIGLTSIIILSLNLSLVKRIMTESEEISEAQMLDGSFLKLSQLSGTLLIAVFLTIAVSNFILALFNRHKKSQMIRHLMYMGFSLASFAVLLIQGNTLESNMISCAIYIFAIAVNRIISFICKLRRPGNVIAFLLIICSYIYLFFPAIYICISILVIDFQAIFHVLPLAFSRIRMDILKKIIKRTYAVEILLGIVLLIVAFSLLLPLFEEGIQTFPDALWYCFAIVTTIGFGDIYATSPVGRIMSVILGIYGIIVVALITSIIVNFYGELRKEDEFEIKEGKENEQSHEKEHSDEKEKAEAQDV